MQAITGASTDKLYQALGLVSFQLRFLHSKLYFLKVFG